MGVMDGRGSLACLGGLRRSQPDPAAHSCCHSPPRQRSTTGRLDHAPRPQEASLPALAKQHL